jgi:hypothetical protein
MYYCRKEIYLLQEATSHFYFSKQDFNLMQKKEKKFSSHVQQLTSNSHETSLCAFTKKELNCNSSYIQKYLTVKPLQ